MDPDTFQVTLLIVQILTLVAIVIYVWKTWTMADATRKAAIASEKALSEMRLTREEENRPFVMIYFQTGLDGTTVDLLIRNIGKLPAKNVTFEFDRRLEQGDWNWSSPISESPKFKNGIAVLPPNLEMREFFAGFVNLQGLCSSYRVKVRYAHPFGDRLYEEEQILEWKSLDGKLGAGNEWHRLVAQFGEELSKIRTQLEKLTEK